MMYQDSMTYLPDDILCKVDRAAMATSLETRVPFLDHRVAELAWQLPLDMKIRGHEGKVGIAPDPLQARAARVDRAAKGRFCHSSGPIGCAGRCVHGLKACWTRSVWLAEGYFHPAPIRQRWAEHLSGQRDHTPSLWAVLMFQAWLEANS